MSHLIVHSIINILEVLVFLLDLVVFLSFL
nr:MAG TPA: hypothetical protein [Caudoviricetes sp.]